jgi:3-isopropylmalate/(R)-2-methylmalate dehydratase small subunit
MRYATFSFEETNMGRVWKFGDNVNTDEIIPGRFNITTDPKALAEHCLCELRPDFPSHVKPGDLIVAGNNFGTGSSREHAPIAIKAAGIRAVIAQSFARIFYRNSINVGLPVIISEGVAGLVEDQDELEIDFEHFRLRNAKTGTPLVLQPLPPFVFKIFQAGGIVPLLREGSLEDLC